MPKKKKEKPDRIDLEIMSALFYLKKATVSDLERLIGMSRATLSDRVKWLVEKNYLSNPEIDVSTDRLRKLYKAPNEEILKNLIYDYYNELAIQEGVSDSIEDFILNDAIEEIADNLSSEQFNRLCQGVDVKEARRVFESFMFLFILDKIVKVVEVNEKVKLTEKGKQEILDYWYWQADRYIKLLRDTSPDDFEEIKKEFCK